MAIFLKGGIAKSELSNERLKALLNEREPRVVRFLARLWKQQQSDISYAQIRKMIETGEITADTMKQWFEDYSRFVTTYLQPEWRAMAVAAALQITERHTVFVFDPGAPAVAEFVSKHGAELVTNCTAQQIEAIRAMVHRASTVQDISVDELARQIRPTIGLYKGQATANLNYYQSIKANLMKENPHMRPETAQKRARLAAIKYAEKQHRYRAHMIARTELAFGYNAGEYHGIKQAQEQGYIGIGHKRWITADDERVCPRCRALDLTTAEMDEPFAGTEVLIPPLHPHCRCVVNYEEEYLEGGEL